MKVHWEAVLTSQADGVIDLEPSEVEDYEALLTEAERTEWMQRLIGQVAHDETYDTEICTCNWLIQEEDG